MAAPTGFNLVTAGRDRRLLLLINEGVGGGRSYIRPGQVAQSFFAKFVYVMCLFPQKFSVK